MGDFSAEKVKLIVAFDKCDKKALIAKLSKIAQEKLGNNTIKAFLKRMYIPANIDILLELLMKSRSINHSLCEKLSNLINRKANKFFVNDSENGHNSYLSIKQCQYIRIGEGMKLQVEIDSIDLDKLLDGIINTMWEGNKARAKKKGQPELKREQELVFQALSSINKGISSEEKLRLLQMLLEWSNKNNVIQQLLETLTEKDPELHDLLEPLKIKFGNITLDI